MREMPVPVEIGQAASVRQAARDCDVLLVSGPAEVGCWLDAVRAPLCVVVAHGDSIWSLKILQGCASVVDHVIAVSKNVQRQLCNGFSSTIIYNGVDTSHLTRMRHATRFALGSASHQVISWWGASCGWLRRSIRNDWWRPSRSPPRFKLFLVGWGALRQKLLDLANEIAPLHA